MRRRSDRGGAAGAFRDAPRSWLPLSALAVLGMLAAWLVVGAVTSSEREAFAVAPSIEAAPPVSALGNDSIPSAEAPLPAGDPATADQPPVDETAEQAPVAAPGAVGRDNSTRVDLAWAAQTAQATGIPLRALLGYAGTELAMAVETPGCGIRWSTLAALGSIESAHGTHAGSSIGDDGLTRPGIFGIDLTGEASARITDTDGGIWDGKADIDRAVGPMQFIPATWETWGADGNGDGVRDPQQIDDAALAAAGYLCHYGDLSSAETWRTAIFAYNHLDTYVDAVARAADDYAGRAGR